MSRRKKDSLLVYLNERGVNLETLKLIQDFYREMRNKTNVYTYPNDNDNDKIFPFGRYRNRNIDDKNIPDNYKKWLLSQKKMMQNFPVFYYNLKKIIDASSEKLPNDSPKLMRTD